MTGKKIAIFSDLAPHVGSATNECRMEMGMTALANLISFLTTGAAINVVKG